MYIITRTRRGYVTMYFEGVDKYRGTRKWVGNKALAKHYPTEVGALRAIQRMYPYDDDIFVEEHEEVKVP